MADLVGGRGRIAPALLVRCGSAQVVIARLLLMIGDFFAMLGAALTGLPHSETTLAPSLHLIGEN